jgi:hypothetical protein
MSCRNCTLSQRQSSVGGASPEKGPSSKRPRSLSLPFRSSLGGRRLCQQSRSQCTNQSISHPPRKKKTKRSTTSNRRIRRSATVSCPTTFSYRRSLSLLTTTAKMKPYLQLWRTWHHNLMPQVKPIPSASAVANHLGIRHRPCRRRRRRRRQKITSSLGRRR